MRRRWKQRRAVAACACFSAGRDTYTARDGQHDDVVLALALSCWAAERYKQVPRPQSFR